MEFQFPSIALTELIKDLRQLKSEVINIGYDIPVFVEMQLISGHYQIQDVDLLTLTKEFGSPLYVYDGEKIVHQLKTLKMAFSGSDVKIKYAAKALTNLSVLKLLRANGSDVDVVSIEEAQLALRAGFKPHQIMFTPSGVDFSEIVEGVKLNLTINLDNLSASGLWP